MTDRRRKSIAVMRPELCTRFNRRLVRRQRAQRLLHRRRHALTIVRTGCAVCVRFSGTGMRKRAGDE